jgi:hypothetical protein
MAAYQNLGPFISTFSDPSRSGFYIDENGMLCPVPKSEDHDNGASSPTHTEAESTENTTTAERSVLPQLVLSCQVCCSS